MAVPDAVKKHGDAAQAAYDKAYGKTTEVTGAPAAPAAPAVPAAAPAAPAAAAPAPAVAPAAPDDPNSPTWEQRFRVLSGKYNAEVPKQAEQIKTLTETVDRLVKANEELGKAARQPLLKPEEIQEYGQPLTDFIQRASLEKLQPVIDELNRRMQALDAIPTHVDTIQKDALKVKQDAFFAGLDARIPDWETINVNPAFTKWLNEVDPLARRTRQAMLDAAQADFDVAGVASFFTQWKQSPTGPASQPTLEAQLSPARGAGNPETPLNPANKKVWTQTEIAAFYDDVRRKRIPEKEAERIEQEINVAMQEGRIKIR